MDLMNVLSFIAVASLLVVSPGPNSLLIAKTVPTVGKIAGFMNIAGFVAAFHCHGALSILGISAIVLASAHAFFVVKMLGAAYLCYIGIMALRDAFSRKSSKQIVKPAKLPRTNISAGPHLKEIEHSPSLTDLTYQSQTIPWPIHLVRKMNVFLEAERRLQKKIDLEPTAEDIAAECGMPVADVKRMLVLRDHLTSADVPFKLDGDKPLTGIISGNNDLNPISKLSAFLEGFLTNALNPKTSMFYLAAFPQFITIGDGVAASAYILVFLHTLINVAWFGTMVFLLARLARYTNRGSFQRWLKGVTGIVFIGFGVKLATYRV